MEFFGDAAAGAFAVDLHFDAHGWRLWVFWLVKALGEVSKGWLCVYVYLYLGLCVYWFGERLQAFAGLWGMQVIEWSAMRIYDAENDLPRGKKRAIICSRTMRINELDL